MQRPWQTEKKSSPKTRGAVVQLCAETWRGSAYLSLSLPLFLLNVRWQCRVPPTVAATKLLRRSAKRLAVILPEANDQVSHSRATQVDLVSADIPEMHHPETRGVYTEARRVTRGERSAMRATAGKVGVRER